MQFSNLHVRLVHDEANLFALAASTSQHMSEIFVKVFATVFGVHFQLEDSQAIEPSNKARQSCFACARNTNKQQMSLRLAINSVNSQNMLQHLIEQHQLDVQLLFTKAADACLNVLLQFFASDLSVILKENN